MNHVLRSELLRMDGQDQSVRAALAADGSLYDGYHPRMAAVHDANAERLRAIVEEHGWPTPRLVGDDGAHAAFRVAQHSINHPELMRAWRELIDRASAGGEVPRWQYAYLDDRIRVFEGRPQRYGTQWRTGPNGPEPYPIEDSERVDSRRAELGLGPLAELLRTAGADDPPWDAERERRREASELAWRRDVGWVR